MSEIVDLYAVIGNPVAHSKSPEIHAQFAAQTQQNLCYQRLLAPLSEFVPTLHTFRRQGGKGVNITVPFKLEAYAEATVLTVRARAAGAVNTLKFEESAIVGDNTDGVGLVCDIVRNAGIVLAGKRVLLLGAGGAARGVILPLLDEGLSELTIVNRTQSKAEELAVQFLPNGPVRSSDFSTLQGPFDIIINATSASLAAEIPPIPTTVFGNDTFVYDMMYASQPTVFMQFAAAHGALTRDGLGMLVEQAAESFFIWRGVRPDTSAIFAELRSKMSV